MHRLFVALRPPESVRDRLIDAMEGIPGARWQDDDQLHVTLRFTGEVDGRCLDDIAAALGSVAGPALDLRIAGVGTFDRRGTPDTLWAGVAPREPLRHLHAKVDRALVAAGLAPERRAFVPHITLARLPKEAGRSAFLARFVAAHTDLASAPFTIDRFGLYESHLGHGGAAYECLATWPLRRAGDGER